MSAPPPQPPRPPPTFLKRKSIPEQQQQIAININSNNNPPARSTSSSSASQNPSKEIRTVDLRGGAALAAITSPPHSSNNNNNNNNSAAPPRPLDAPTLAAASSSSHSMTTKSSVFGNSGSPGPKLGNAGRLRLSQSASLGSSNANSPTLQSKFNIDNSNPQIQQIGAFNNGNNMELSPSPKKPVVATGAATAAPTMQQYAYTNNILTPSMSSSPVSPQSNNNNDNITLQQQPVASISASGTYESRVTRIPPKPMENEKNDEIDEKNQDKTEKLGNEKDGAQPQPPSVVVVPSGSKKSFVNSNIVSNTTKNNSEIGNTNNVFSTTNASTNKKVDNAATPTASSVPIPPRLIPVNNNTNNFMQQQQQQNQQPTNAASSALPPQPNRKLNMNSGYNMASDASVQQLDSTGIFRENTKNRNKNQNEQTRQQRGEEEQETILYVDDDDGDNGQNGDDEQTAAALLKTSQRLLQNTNQMQSRINNQLSYNSTSSLTWPISTSMYNNNNNNGSNSRETSMMNMNQRGASMNYFDMIHNNNNNNRNNSNESNYYEHDPIVVDVDALGMNNNNGEFANVWRNNNGNVNGREGPYRFTQPQPSFLSRPEQQQREHLREFGHLYQKNNNHRSNSNINEMQNSSTQAAEAINVFSPTKISIGTIRQAVQGMAATSMNPQSSSSVLNNNTGTISSDEQLAMNVAHVLMQMENEAKLELTSGRLALGRRGNANNNIANRDFDPIDGDGEEGDAYFPSPTRNNRSFEMLHQQREQNQKQNMSNGLQWPVQNNNHNNNNRNNYSNQQQRTWIPPLRDTNVHMKTTTPRNFDQGHNHHQPQVSHYFIAENNNNNNNEYNRYNNNNNNNNAPQYHPPPQDVIQSMAAATAAAWSPTKFNMMGNRNDNSGRQKEFHQDWLERLDAHSMTLNNNNVNNNLNSSSAIYQRAPQQYQAPSFARPSRANDNDHMNATPVYFDSSAPWPQQQHQQRHGGYY